MDTGKPSEDGFEEGLRQILSQDPPTGAEAPRPKPRREDTAKETAAKLLEAERKAAFWVNLLRPLASIALLAFLAAFVIRIVNAR
jgi:hypothetical protein